jgi:DNA-binding LacI/PurR family transcriptional regulator
MDVAREAGVSHMTVSRVINKKNGINKTTRARVLEAIERLAYKPNSVARSLVIKKTRLLGIIVPDIDNPFFSGMVKGTERIAHENDYNIILCDTEGLVENEKKYMDLMVERMVDGVILAAPRMDDEELVTYNQMIPIVVLDRHFPSGGITHIWADNIEGASQAMEYLIRLGHERIGFITGPEIVQVSLMRKEGYKRSLLKHGIHFDPHLVAHGDFLFESGYKNLDYFFRVRPHPTAIFSSNDIMALGLLKRAKETGIHIPNDVSIIGFDDITLSSLISPPLTTVHHPVVEMGKRAVHQLLHKISNSGEHEDEVQLLNHLVVRKSARTVFN